MSLVEATDGDGRETPQVRLSDAERDAVVRDLRQAADEGRLSLAEFEERTGKVYAAQFPSDLEPLVRDLPIAIPTETVAEVEPKPREKQSRWLVQVVGGSDRRGEWDPGEETRSFTLLGGQSIDLTEVAVDYVYIRAYTIIGTTEIIVPDGASVDLDGHILFGGSGNKAMRNGPSTMRVVVRARGALGRLEVRNLKRRERKRRER